MKFLCLPCDQAMTLEERKEPGDGTFAVAYKCPSCAHEIAMLANPMETQLVGALGVRIGGEELSQPMDLVRTNMVGGDAAMQAEGPPGNRPVWTPDGRARLDRVPSFVRGMVKRIYTEWAVERGVTEITPAVMDEARSDLGLEGM